MALLVNPLKLRLKQNPPERALVQTCKQWYYVEDSLSILPLVTTDRAIWKYHTIDQPKIV